MPSAHLLGAYQVGDSRIFRFEVLPSCYLETFTSLRYKLSHDGPPATKPTKGELLARVETLSWKSRSVKRKTLDSPVKGGPSWGKVPKLGSSSSSPSAHVRVWGQMMPPLSEVPRAPSSQPRSGSAAKTKDSSGRAAEPPLEVMPITVWSPSAQSAKPPSSRVEELRGKRPEVDGDGDSLLFNAELAASAVLSILRESNLKRSGALPVKEALALSLKGGRLCKFPCLVVSVFILGSSCALTLNWVSAGGYSFEEFCQEG